MNNNFEVGYNPKNKRLLIKAPFYLVDVCRGFPSRRFDPKTKFWAVPLVRVNLVYLEEVQKKYTVLMTPEAIAAVKDAETLIAGPVKIPFPRHVYDFTKSEKKYQPMEHQDRMLDDSWNLPASAWFAKMGTGKTFAQIHLACARWSAGQIEGMMIICPATLRLTWKKELAKYATVPYDFRIHETKASWYDDWLKDRDPSVFKILAVSVEGLGISEQSYNSACGFLYKRRVLTVVDESSRIKNPSALRTKRTIELGAASHYRQILNGTPIALGIHDLWAQYEFLDPNIIGAGDYWAFRTRYIVYGGYENKKIIGYQNVDELMDRLKPYTTEVDKSVLNLPPKIPKTRWIMATQEQKDLFKQILKGVGPYPRIKVTNVLEKMLRLRQVVGGYRPETVIDPETEMEKTILHPLKGKNPKMDDLFEFIEANYVGTKFIIWSTFVHEIEEIARWLAEKYSPESVECYYGKTEQEDRSRIEDRYCTDPTLRFFVGNPTAAGLGLTLISGEDDVMYYYSGTSAFIDRAQSEDRAHRIGQHRSVVIVDAVMEKTIDETIQASIAAKLDMETFVFSKLKEGMNEIDLLGGGE